MGCRKSFGESLFDSVVFLVERCQCDAGGVSRPFSYPSVINLASALFFHPDS